MGAAEEPPIRVLESFRAPRATTNPYLVLLLRSFPADVRVSTFSWPRAILGRYDVFHVHWPEVVVDRRHPVRAAAAALLFAIVLLRCRVTRTPVVRTVHNLRPHERPRATTAAAIALCDRVTGAWVRLNEQTPMPGPLTVTVPLGHYRDWYAPRGGRPVPGRVVTFGLLRPYKGVEHLVEAFHGTRREGLSLRVLGRPTSPAIRSTVESAAAADPRVGARLEHVPDEDLVAEIEAAELVVLPYERMHNSAAALLALSLDRPILVPRNDVTRALAAEVGAGWVHLFDGHVRPADLEAALAAGPPPGRPDLTARDWPEVGTAHRDLFRAALAAARPQRSPRRVALVGTRGVPARYGGFETAVEEVGRRLAAAGHDVVVYCRPVPGEPTPSQHLGMRLVHLPAVRHRALETLSHTALSALHLLTHRVDAAVMFNAANAPLLPLLRLARIPVATHVDGLEWRRAKWGPTGRRYYRAAEALAVRWSDALIADAQGMADYYAAEFGAPTRLISYGAPIVPRAHGRLAELELAPGGYHLVVARFEPENHVDVVVAGYVASRARLPLVVVGSAPYAEAYTAAVHAAADERVRFLGGVWDAELLDQLFANAATYLHGHSVGGTNPALLRAIGAGAPTAAFDVSFNREVLRHHGRYFTTAADVAALVEAAEADPAGTAARGEALRARALDYDWDDVAARYADLLADLAGRRVARPGLSGRRRSGQVPPRTEPATPAPATTEPTHEEDQ